MPAVVGDARPRPDEVRRGELVEGHDVVDRVALVAHERDRPDNQGRWYHVMLTIDVAGARYRAAVDVDSHQSATGVQWKD